MKTVVKSGITRRLDCRMSRNYVSGREHHVKLDLVLHAVHTAVHNCLDEQDRPYWLSEENSKILPLLTIVLTTIGLVFATGKGHHVKWFPSKVFLSPGANRPLHLWQIRHCRASLCRNRLTGITEQEKMISSFRLSLGRCFKSTNASSANIRIRLWNAGLQFRLICHAQQIGLEHVMSMTVRHCW